MARAYNIHLVRLAANETQIIAAFTVRHEMETWLERQRRYRRDALTTITVREGSPLWTYERQD